MSFKNNLIPVKPIISFTATARETSQFPEQLEFETQVLMQQTHQDEIIEITEQQIKSPKDRQVIIPQVDGCFTTLKKVLLNVKHADCLPILVAATEKSSQLIIGAIHAGRKSTEKKIMQKFCQILKSKYNIQEITFWLGPCICPICYQIDKVNNIHFDLRKEITSQINDEFAKDLRSDLKILNHDACTLHNSQAFFSYRREGAGVVMNHSGIMIA